MRRARSGSRWSRPPGHENFRAAFIGKVSPIQFFWGAMDLACTRFSGRPAPTDPGGAPNCPDRVMVEGYSRELSSCGFWPGGGKEGAFYSYAYPGPDGFSNHRIEPSSTYFAANSENSCCPTRPCAPPMTRTTRSPGSCRPRMRPPPNLATGTAAHSNATRIACSRNQVVHCSISSTTSKTVPLGDLTNSWPRLSSAASGSTSIG
jgi:hypothetical protein